VYFLARADQSNHLTRLTINIELASQRGDDHDLREGSLVLSPRTPPTARSRWSPRNPVDDEYEKTFTLGERLADRLADFGGSWNFIAIFGAVLLGKMTDRIYVLSTLSEWGRRVIQLKNTPSSEGRTCLTPPSSCRKAEQTIPKECENRLNR